MPKKKVNRYRDEQGRFISKAAAAAREAALASNTPLSYPEPLPSLESTSGGPTTVESTPETTAKPATVKSTPESTIATLHSPLVPQYSPTVPGPSPARDQPTTSESEAETSSTETEPALTRIVTIDLKGKGRATDLPEHSPSQPNHCPNCPVNQIRSMDQGYPQ